MSSIRYAIYAAAMILSISTSAPCQIAPPPARTLSLAGPRFGITTLSPRFEVWRGRCQDRERA